MSLAATDSHLRAILLAPQLDKLLREHPFACVVSVAPGEEFHIRPKPCLLVFCRQDDELGFADGVYACEREPAFVGGSVDWPVLSAALSREVKAYAAPLMPKDGELPFQRVKLWQEYDGHSNPRLADDAEGHALLALSSAHKWNGWMRDAQAASENKRSPKWGFDDALKSIVSREVWAAIRAKAREAKEGDAFRKWCAEIGLVKPHLTDFATPYNQLLDLLNHVLQVHQGVRAGWTEKGKP